MQNYHKNGVSEGMASMTILVKKQNKESSWPNGQGMMNMPAILTGCMSHDICPAKAIASKA